MNYRRSVRMMAQGFGSRRRRLLVGALLLALVMPMRGVVSAQSGAKTEAKILTLGLISEINRAAIEEHFLDFVRYVGRRLTPEVGGRVVVASTSFDLVKMIEQRQVDFYFESVYSTYSINYVHGVGRTILRRWKSGLAEYQSLLFTKKDGGVKRLDELRGKTIAFEDPGSTSGYLMPKIFLQRNGFRLAEKKDYDANATPDQISYVFVPREDKLLAMVLSKQAAAGAISDDSYGRLSNERKAEIAVLAQTERLPRHLVSVRADLAPQTVARLTDILIAMHDDPEGLKILSRTDRTTKFDRLPGGEEALRKRLLESFYSADRK